MSKTTSNSDLATSTNTDEWRHRILAALSELRASSSHLSTSPRGDGAPTTPRR
jgi:hypothetical protein